MLFNSVHFLVFFPLVLILYFTLPRRARQIMLLGASYYFYMSWKAEYAVLIAMSTVVDYFASIQMGKRTEKKSRRPFLIISLVANLGLLFAFKYFNFALDSANMVLDQFNHALAIPRLNVLLPVGISFYTFQTIGYSIDVYRGDRKPEKNWVVFALYVSFFPQLVAGPIERARRLIPQFHEDRRSQVDFDRLVNGLAMILWGFFMKLVIADNAAIYINNVYGAHTSYTGGHFLIAMYLFAYQVFCDFAGYSCIAIGTAGMMGYDMMQNFRRPYLARTFADLWARWHISLMTWFRDYLYRPLHKKGANVWRVVGTLYIIYIVSGFWHGAAWTFVAWSVLNWKFVALERIINNWEWAKRIKRPAWTDKFGIFRVVETFIVVSFFAFAGIYFRSRTMDQAHYVMRHLFDFPKLNMGYLASLVLPFTGDYSALAFGLTLGLMLVLLEAIHLVQESKHVLIMKLWQESSIFKGACLIGLALIVLFFGNFNSNSFVYFQF